MEYNLKLKDDVTKINIENGVENEMTVEMNDQKVKVSYSFISDNHIHLDINDNNISTGTNIYMTGSAEEKTIMINGTAYHLQDEDLMAQSQTRKKSDTDLPDEITPPMPAVVVSIPVSNEDTVQKGDGVIVLSAMKMETTLVAPYNGKVTSINVAEGDKVMPGEILVDIEKIEEE